MSKRASDELLLTSPTRTGAIDDNTLVVTSVHDAQVVDDIPSEELLKHDVPVDM